MNESTEKKLPSLSLQSVFESPNGEHITVDVSITVDSDSLEVESAMVNVAQNPYTWIHVWRTFQQSIGQCDNGENTFEMDAAGTMQRLTVQ